MFKTNAFTSFYSLLLSLFLSAYPPNCCFHPCSNQLDSQVSTFSFSSNRPSLLSSIYCLHLCNKYISEMVFLWPPHFFFRFIPCLGKVYFMRSLYRWEKEQKKMKINHCWIIWYSLFLDYKISKRNHCENSRVHFSWAAQKISCMMIKHGAVEKTKLQDAKFNLGEQKICSWHSNLKAKFNSANRLDFSLNKSLCFERFIILFFKVTFENYQCVSNILYTHVISCHCFGFNLFNFIFISHKTYFNYLGRSIWNKM